MTIAKGRIVTLSDGTIDTTRTNSERGARTDPAKQHYQHARQMGADKAAATRPLQQVAIRAMADTLRNADTAPGTLATLETEDY